MKKQIFQKNSEPAFQLRSRQAGFTPTPIFGASRPRQRGFTLIELLAVISIIGLLSTLAVVALNNARLKSRDAKRVSDIKQIQTALELHYNDANAYPPAVAAGGTIASGGVTYMSNVPANPTPVNDGACAAGNTYTYIPGANNTTYALRYCLGGAAGSVTAGYHTAYPGSIQ